MILEVAMTEFIGRVRKQKRDRVLILVPLPLAARCEVVIFQVQKHADVKG